MAYTRNERSHILSVEGNDISDVGGRNIVSTDERGDTISVEGNDSAPFANKGNFFSMFYLPSNQAFDEDVHFTSLSYSAPFQGAATAVMGSFFSVLDTAMEGISAVLNEEFDQDRIISGSIISDSTKDEDEGLHRNVTSCISGDRSGIGCYEEAARSSLSKPSSTNDNISGDKTSGMMEQSAEQEIDVTDFSSGQSCAQENDDFTPHSSLIGSISTLQLYEEDAGDAMKKLLSALHSESMSDMQIGTNISADSKPESRENEDYYMIKNESETNDGWLVVCDD